MIFFMEDKKVQFYDCDFVMIQESFLFTGQSYFILDLVLCKILISWRVNFDKGLIDWMIKCAHNDSNPLIVSVVYQKPYCFFFSSFPNWDVSQLLAFDSNILFCGPLFWFWCICHFHDSFLAETSFCFG